MVFSFDVATIASQLSSDVAGNYLGLGLPNDRQLPATSSVANYCDY